MILLLAFSVNDHISYWSEIVVSFNSACFTYLYN